MKIIKQLGLLLGITFFSEMLYRLLGLPIPASVYGLILLFSALLSGFIRLEQIEDVGNFLLLAMPVFFIAPGVNLMNLFEEIRPILFSSLLLILVSTVFITVVTGKVADLILRGEERNE